MGQPWRGRPAGRTGRKRRTGRRRRRYRHALGIRFHLGHRTGPAHAGKTGPGDTRCPRRLAAPTPAPGVAMVATRGRAHLRAPRMCRRDGLAAGESLSRIRQTLVAATGCTCRRGEQRWRRPQPNSSRWCRLRSRASWSSERQGYRTCVSVDPQATTAHGGAQRCTSLDDNGQRRTGGHRGHREGRLRVDLRDT